MSLTGVLQSGDDMLLLLQLLCRLFVMSYRWFGGYIWAFLFKRLMPFLLANSVKPQKAVQQ